MAHKSKRATLTRVSPFPTEARQPLPSVIPTYRSLGCLLALLGYFLTVFCIGKFDAFTTDFTTTGGRLFLYNIARVIFLFYFTWFLIGSGLLGLSQIRKRGIRLNLSKGDNLLLAFFTGAAITTITMLPIGYLNLYYTETALLLTTPILVLSYPHLVYILRDVREGTQNLLSPKGGWSLAHTGKILLIFALIWHIGVMLISRCIYPGETSNDVYDIYWPYQQLVITSHGLWPNEVWYMSFAFQGAGLNFLAMLLSDTLACQSVTLCLLLAGIFTAYSIVRRICDNTTLALLAAISSLACFEYTNPGWGSFQSHHISAGAWVACMVWMAVQTFERPPEEYKAWFILWSILAAAEAIFFPLFIIVFSFPMLGAMCFGNVIARNYKVARGYFTVGLTAGCTLVAVMLLNYKVAGMFLDNPLRVMWKYANQETFSRWCSPYFPMYILEGSAPGTAGVSFSSLFSHTFDFWSELFRAKSFGLLCIHPLVPPALFLVVIAFLARAGTQTPSWFSRWKYILPVLLPLAGGILVADSGHPSSVFRNYGLFCFFLPIILSLVWLAFIDVLFPSQMRGNILLSYCLLVTGVRIYKAQRKCVAHAEPLPTSASHWNDFFRFAIGSISFNEALQRGDGLWTTALKAKQLIGVNERLFSFNRPNHGENASYFFPGSGLLTEPSRIGFSGNWHVISFGDADGAIAALRKEGVNYFLIDFSRPFFGAIPFSQLFNPDHLAERFDLVWAEGSACVLTWKGSGTPPLPPAVATALRQRVQINKTQPNPHPDGVMGRLFDNLKAIYDFNQGRNYPVVRPPDLPPVLGWQ